jgi:hypothetical protein
LKACPSNDTTHCGLNLPHGLNLFAGGDIGK